MEWHYLVKPWLGVTIFVLAVANIFDFIVNATLLVNNILCAYTGRSLLKLMRILLTYMHYDIAKDPEGLDSGRWIPLIGGAIRQTPQVRDSPIWIQPRGVFRINPKPGS